MLNINKEENINTQHIMKGVFLVGVVFSFMLIFFITEESRNDPMILALNGVLQFICAIGLSWLFTLDSSEKLFEDRQKSSARRSYRHTKKIKESSSILLDELNMKIKLYREKNENNIVAEFENIKAYITMIQSFVDAGIDDWGDLIGDEIAAINEYESLKKGLIRLLEQYSLYETRVSNEKRDDNEEELCKIEQENLQKGIKALRKHIEEKEKLLPNWAIAAASIK